MRCHDLRPDLGAYVVGALEPGERARLEAHLEGCPGCRDELAELAGLPGLLSHLTAAEVEAGPPEPSAGSLDRMIAEFDVRRRRDTRRHRLLAVAAAAVVVAGAGSATAVLMNRQPTTANPVAGRLVATASARDATTHVAATAWLRTTAWGTSVQLRLTGVPADVHCKLIAVATDGHRESGGSWEASYTGTANVTSTVSVAPADIRSLDIQTLAGRPLVTVPVHPAAPTGNATSS
jgi:predicted anti-sigma-YlaC factor YlaD